MARSSVQPPPGSWLRRSPRGQTGVMPRQRKQLGEFKVPVRLHKDVTADVTVQVVKEE